MRRKDPLVTGNIYHILNKSIAGYTIFNSEEEFVRMTQMLRFFSLNINSIRFYRLIDHTNNQLKRFEQFLEEQSENDNPLVDIIAYCIMPTHFHLILRQLKDNGISTFAGNISNSYTRYFNTKHKRKGHLWEGIFKNVPTLSNEQLMHLTRYVHLNPVTAGLVEKPEQWSHSSYKEYITPEKVDYPLCKFSDLLNTSPDNYREFVEDQKDYQKELAKIKKITLE